MIKVAILGSCVTRDIFISKINPQYKQHFEVVLFQNHTTLLSLLSPKIHYKNTDFSNLSWRNMEMIKNELDKEFLNNLTKIQPDILIIDFFSDAFFDTIKDGNSFLTVNIWKTISTKHFHKISLNNTPFTPSVKDLKKYILELSNYLIKNLPNTKIILNKTKTVDKYINDYNDIVPFKNVKNINDKWTQIDNIFEQANKPFIINNKHKYIGLSSHIWGLSNVHYEKEYYIQSLHSILNISLQKNKKTFLQKIYSIFH
jgi:hypothetical protein